jgi:hypothetical protein
MRLLTEDQQAEILKETCHFFKTQSNFRVDPPSTTRPCSPSIRITIGEEEGLSGWLPVNCLTGELTIHSQDWTTHGFLDIEGASTHTPFEPSLAERNNPDNSMIEVRLRLLGGEEIVHKVFVTTWLGYGTNQVRERYVAQAISDFESNRSANPDPSSDDPCLPKDLKLAGQPLQFPSTSQRSKQPRVLVELVPSNDASRRLLRSSTKTRRVPLSPVSSMAHTFHRSTFRVPSSPGCRNAGTLPNIYSGLVARMFSSNTKGPRWSFANGGGPISSNNTGVPNRKAGRNDRAATERTGEPPALESGAIASRFIACRYSVSKPPGSPTFYIWGLGMPRLTNSTVTCR